LSNNAQLPGQPVFLGELNLVLLGVGSPGLEEEDSSDDGHEGLGQIEDGEGKSKEEFPVAEGQQPVDEVKWGQDGSKDGKEGHDFPSEFDWDAHAALLWHMSTLWVSNISKASLSLSFSVVSHNNVLVVLKIIIIIFTFKSHLII
jgi:hypothetical protein